LLVLENVTQRYRQGSRVRVALNDVSLVVEPGELVGVWGTRRSGRSTLLRVAAGIELAQEGRVMFAGRDLARHRDEVLGGEIGFCQMSFASVEGGCVGEQVAAPLLARRVAPAVARCRAEAMLERAGVADCAWRDPCELDPAEVARVSIARALMTDPGLLVVDEPTSGVGAVARDPLLALLRSVANEGCAVLMSVGEASELSGVDRAMSMVEGVLRGAAESASADVLPLRRPVPGRDRGLDGGGRREGAGGV